MMAATLAKGKTIINNSAKEPEVVDLASCLRKWVQKFQEMDHLGLRLRG